MYRTVQHGTANICTIEDDEVRKKCIEMMYRECADNNITVICDEDDDCEWYPIIGENNYFTLRIGNEMSIVEMPFITWKGRW